MQSNDAIDAFAFDAECFLKSNNITQVTLLPPTVIDGREYDQCWSIVTANGRYFGASIADAVAHIRKAA